MGGGEVWSPEIVDDDEGEGSLTVAVATERGGGIFKRRWVIRVKLGLPGRGAAGGVKRRMEEVLVKWLGWYLRSILAVLHSSRSPLHPSSPPSFLPFLTFNISFPFPMTLRR